MNLGQSLLLGGVAVLVVSAGAAGQSPTPIVSPMPTSPPPSTSPAPSTAPAPSATPFLYPTIPRQRLARGTFAEWPSGRPPASTTDRGVRLDLWLSSTEAAPGDWVQAIVRATNVGDDTAWVRTGDECSNHTLTRVEVDLAPTTPMGIEQSGLAGDFKDRLLARGLTDHFRSPTTVFGRDATGLTVHVLAECTNVRPAFLVEPILPGGTRTERFYWQAGRRDPYGPRGRLLPLFPGTAPVTLTWAVAGRGVHPSQERLERWIRSMRVTSAIELMGDGPDTPSYPELIDSALADPEFGAWVAEHPFQRGWVTWRADLRHDDYSAYLRRDRYLTPDNAPNGALELFVGHGTRVNSPSLDPRAGIYLDPWTGAVIARWLTDWCADPAECAR